MSTRLSRRQLLSLMVSTAGLSLTAPLARGASPESWDLIVVGGGNAGLPAAIFAAERGARVLIVDAAGAKSLAKMKSRVELQGEVVLIAQSPGSNLAGAIVGPAGAIAGCIKSLVEKLEDAA